MFTGLVEEVGTLHRVADTPAGRELRVSCSFTDLMPGESIAVNGACLTVRECGDGWFTCAAIGTTLERTSIGTWIAGRRVNLERAMRANDRFGGHIVQGHVDGVGRVLRAEKQGDALLVDLALPAGLSDFMVPHGSLTVDGVSLTVNELPAPDSVQVSLIEYTLQHTTLAGLAPGHAVHIEADIIGKYIQRLVAPHLRAAAYERDAGA